MHSRPGERISFRLLPDLAAFDATLLSLDEQRIVLRAEGLPAAIAGRYVVIIDPVDDTDYYAEIDRRDGAVLTLKRMWAGKRDYFRVDDVFPVEIRKVPDEPQYRKSRVFAAAGAALPEYDAPDDGVSPRLWKLLADINAKLGAVLEKLEMERAGVPQTGDRAVNISASGIRLRWNAGLRVGDPVEVRLLLPLIPMVGIIAPGTVVRAEHAGGGGDDLSVEFGEIDDDVRDILIQYTLKRQRELIRRERQHTSGE